MALHNLQLLRKIYSFTGMKYINIFYSLFFVLLISVSSCTNKSCEGVVCGPNKQCSQVDGKCYCADGYEGDDCTTEAYPKYIKSFYVYETCQNVSPIPQSTTFITQGSQVNLVWINNFRETGLQVRAIIRTDQANKGNSLEIQRQNVGGIIVEGYGTYNTPNAGQITFELSISEGGGPSFTCQQRFIPIP